MFYQADLFEQSPPSAPRAVKLVKVSLKIPDLVDRIAAVTRRPRYALLVLELIAREAGPDGSLGPHVHTEEGRVPVRDWLCQALAPLAKRDCRRMALVEAVRTEVMAAAGEGSDAADLERTCVAEIQNRIIRSGRTSISRAVSDLVKAGLLRRHYQGYRVDHPNRGAQREAVYTITSEVRQTLRRH
ncbi:hypothetical protein [Sphingobium sp. AP50]|uniref:hypothetical protein n=1 Tax=Sphingobium sp. AP50 TaxID=1884369 RepID=UPI000B887155|nr:hypothetical protein [Sphingobium sp. AP50]